MTQTPTSPGTSMVDPDSKEVRLFDPEFARCPHATYEALREQCPVTRAAFTRSPVVSRYEDVLWALRHPEIFSSEMDLQMALGNERPMIPQQIDPPAQTRYRRLLDPHFSRRKMELLIPSIREQANLLIDGFVEMRECEFDSAFAIPLPCQAFLSLLGLPQEDLELFLALKDGIIRPSRRGPEGDAAKLLTPEEAKQIRVDSGQQIYAYFESALDARERSPREDLLSSLLGSEIEGEKLERNEILDICFLLLLAGLDTVTATLGCNIAFLASNPLHRERLVADPNLMPGAVEELLRWETPVTGVPRVARRKVEIGGFEIAEGELVTFLLGSANTDGAHFVNADRVDFARERNVHMAFGAGPHRCLGSHLARMELQVAMEEWHRRIPSYAIKTGEIPIYSPGIREVMYLPLVWS